MEIKTCTKCLKEKPIAEYHKNRTKCGGYEHHCKDCRREERIGWYNKNPFKYRRHSKEWKERTRTQRAKQSYGWRQKNMEHLKEYVKNHPLTKLRRKTYYLIERGEIEKTPCVICGDLKVHAHHIKPEPEAIRFYCQKHHSRLHRYIRYINWRTIQANERYLKDRV